MISEILLVTTVLLIGYVFMFLEIVIVPGFGVPGLLSIASLCGGTFLAFRFFGGVIGSGVVVGIFALTTVILIRLPRTRMGKGIVLEDSLARAKAATPDLAVGDLGLAESDLRPSGIVRFGLRRESAVTGGEYIDQGNRVRVVLVEGSRVVVEKITDGI